MSRESGRGGSFVTAFLRMTILRWMVKRVWNERKTKELVDAVGKGKKSGDLRVSRTLVGRSPAETGAGAGSGEVEQKER